MENSCGKMSQTGDAWILKKPPSEGTLNPACFLGGAA